MSRRPEFNQIAPLGQPPWGEPTRHDGCVILKTGESKPDVRSTAPEFKDARAD